MLFNALDVDGGGTIDFEELNAMLSTKSAHVKMNEQLRVKLAETRDWQRLLARRKGQARRDSARNTFLQIERAALRTATVRTLIPAACPAIS